MLTKNSYCQSYSLQTSQYINTQQIYAFTVELWLVHSYLLYKCYEHRKGESNFYDLSVQVIIGRRLLIKVVIFFSSSQLVILKSSSAMLIWLIFTTLVPLVCAEELHINLIQDKLFSPGTHVSKHISRNTFWSSRLILKQCG